MLHTIENFKGYYFIMPRATKEYLLKKMRINDIRSKRHKNQIAKLVNHSMRNNKYRNVWDIHLNEPALNPFKIKLFINAMKLLTRFLSSKKESSRFNLFQKYCGRI